MTIMREQLLGIRGIINKKINEVFDINTQYNFLILNKKINEEMEIVQQQAKYIIERYGEKDTTDSLIISEDGGIKIKNEYKEKCQEELDKLYKCESKLPDIYFTLEELQELKLTLKELILLEPFIKR